MKIRKEPATRNEWIYAEGLWVRNFTKTDSQPISINSSITRSDYKLFINNTLLNDTLNIANIADEKFSAKNIVIVSDGYQFEDKHKILSKLKNVIVIAVNRSLARWQLMLDTLPDSQKKSINAYIVNNPYEECLSYIPKKYFPVCVASIRTNHNFIKKYKGSIYFYEPSPEITFGQAGSRVYYIDDYRNPICAAIGFSYRLGVEKLMLMCCDDVFQDERPGSIQLNNGLWMYPQHQISHGVIDANLYWLTHQEEHEVKVLNYSNGPEYKYAKNVNHEDEIISFFN